MENTRTSVCQGNDGTTDYTSNEVVIIVHSDLVSVSPDGEQKIKNSQSCYPIILTETGVADSRQWVYSSTPGESYVAFTVDQTDTMCIPVFPDAGTYYVVCKSVIGAITETSPIFSTHTDLSPGKGNCCRPRRRGRAI